MTAIKARFVKAMSPRLEVCAAVSGGGVGRDRPPRIGQIPAAARRLAWRYGQRMGDDEPDTTELKRRQLAQEQLEREQLADSETDADAERHRRRADKARYLRQKLEQRERSEREADDGDG